MSSFTLAAAVSLVVALPVPAGAAEVTVASMAGPPARIVVHPHDAMLQKTGAWLARYLASRGYQASPLSTRSAPGAGTVIALETLANASSARALGINLSELQGARADAFILSAGRQGAKSYVSLVGRNSQGVRSALARMIAEARENNAGLQIAEGSKFHAPFFPIRRLHVCPTGRIAQDNAWCRQMGLPSSNKRWADTLWTNWSDDRLKKYAEQLWLYGFNSVEIAEIRGYRGVFSDADLKTTITPKIRVFARALRDNGLQVSQFIWGQSLFKEGENYCWNSSSEQATMKKEYRRLARTYGDLVDHIVVHVGDPGGCTRNGCDPYKTTQQIASSLLSEYRKVNPRVTATLSTWANEGFWHGREGDRFLDTKYSPAEMGIALHRWYDPYPAKIVTDARRPLDIWGWYLSDFELSLDNHLLMRRLDRYFRMLPPEASKQVRAVSTEINFSGWPQLMNAYVSAQKMWDPNRDLGDIEREFCAGTFGDENSAAMVKVYDACEANVHPENYYGFIPPTDALPVVFGTPEYNRQVQDALSAASGVRISPGFSSRLTTATLPASLSGYLFRDLKLIDVFSRATEQVRAARERGAPGEEVARIIADARSAARPFEADPDHAKLASDLARVAMEKG